MTATPFEPRYLGPLDMAFAKALECPAVANEVVLRRALREKYGDAVPYDRYLAAALLGTRSQAHPEDTAASLYLTEAAAKAYGRANRERWGHPTFGPVQTADGWVGAIDMRPALIAAGLGATILSPEMHDQPTMHERGLAALSTTPVRRGVLRGLGATLFGVPDGRR